MWAFINFSVDPCKHFLSCPESVLRKLLSISILCCLVIYIGGYHLIYAVYRAGIKQEMRAYLQKNKDTRLGTYFSFAVKDKKITDTHFSWEEKDEEFSYDGKMYDVVTVAYHSDSARICALKDERENNLAEQLAVIHNGNHTDSEAGAKTAFHFFSVFTMIQEPFYPCRTSFIIRHWPGSAERILLDLTEVTTPPPRC